MRRCGWRRERRVGLIMTDCPSYRQRLESNGPVCSLSPSPNELQSRFSFKHRRPQYMRLAAASPPSSLL